MKCPFCKFNLVEFDVTMEHFIPLYACNNPKCEESKNSIGTQEIWECINRYEQALDIANAVIINNANEKIELNQNPKERKDDNAGKRAKMG